MASNQQELTAHCHLALHSRMPEAAAATAVACNLARVRNRPELKGHSSCHLANCSWRLDRTKVEAALEAEECNTKGNNCSHVMEGGKAGEGQNSNNGRNQGHFGNLGSAEAKAAHSARVSRGFYHEGVRRGGEPRACGRTELARTSPSRRGVRGGI